MVEIHNLPVQFLTSNCTYHRKALRLESIKAVMAILNSLLKWSYGKIKG
jgi:hypothetical protein